jgi:intracellular sulfur oxidation DsrE/DsrF family protein
MGFRAKIDPVLVLDAKGEKIRPKQEMDQLPLENFKKNRVRVFVCQNTLVCLLLSKVGLLWEEWVIMGKSGVFEIFDQYLLEQLYLCLNKCV